MQALPSPFTPRRTGPATNRTDDGAILARAMPSGEILRFAQDDRGGRTARKDRSPHHAGGRVVRGGAPNDGVKS